ncbi:eukaryotic translation initiation factor 4 gamma 1-like [Brachyhypopomus gauderio]|uniref:eukaryotic translation initiation factor 4 gamma 1-like n=1 Tax=Brachyhypopomus gauderio TaxID=698409 RepID=UPI004042E5E7
MQQQLLSKKDSSQGRDGQDGSHPSGGHTTQPQDEGSNTVPMLSKKDSSQGRDGQDGSHSSGGHTTQPQDEGSNTVPMLSKKDSSQGRDGLDGSHPSGGRTTQPQDEGSNTVPITTKTQPIDTSRRSKINRPWAMGYIKQLLVTVGKGSQGSYGKSSSGGSGAKPSGEQESGRPATSTLDHFPALQQSGPSSTSSSLDADHRVSHRSSPSKERADRERSERFDRRDSREDRERVLDRNRPAVTKRNFSRESDDPARGGEGRGAVDIVRRVASMTEDRGSRERGSRDRAMGKEMVKRETAPIPPPAPAKPALSEEELEKKSVAIIEEYLHINDLKEAVQCVQELNSQSLLFVFVRNVVESTLERSTIARGHMDQLLHRLVSKSILPIEQYHKGVIISSPLRATLQNMFKNSTKKLVPLSDE